MNMKDVPKGYILTPEALVSQLNYIKTLPKIGFDIETTGGLFEGGAIAGFSFAYPVGKGYQGYYVPLEAPSFTCQIPRELIVEFLQSLPPVVVFSGETELSYAKDQFGVDLKIGGDAYIQALSLQLKNDSLKTLSQEFLLAEVIFITELDGLNQEDFDFSKVLLNEKTLSYTVQDSVYAYALEEVLNDKISQMGLVRIYELEKDLLPVLVSMYLEGFPVDKNLVDPALKMVKEELAELEDQIFTMVDYPRFPINSPAKKAAFLYDHLGLPCPKTTGKGGRSADDDCLEFIQNMHPVVPLLREWMSKFSVKSGMEKIDGKLSSDGRLHAKFRPIGYSATSRIYTVPSANSLSKPLRTCVQPPEGKYFWYADISGAEFILLARLAGQTNITSAYDSGVDIPTYMTQFMTGLSEEEAKAKREVGKVGMYATVYGSEGASVAMSLKISQNEAESLVDSVWTHLDAMDLYRSNLIESAMQSGYTSTLMGRKRRLSNLFSASHSEVAKAKRQVVNTAVQSGVADIAKVMMIRMHDRIESQSLPYKIRMHVFDSFLLEIPVEISPEKVAEDFVDILSEPVTGMKFNFKVGSSSESWAAAQKAADVSPLIYVSGTLQNKE